MSGEQHFAHLMMFLYKTRPCPGFKSNKCEFTEEECFDWHEPKVSRREPWKNNRGKWNYSHIDKCQTGYNQVHNCKHKARCQQYHSLHEMNFHPEEYKRTKCRFYPNCHRGPQCWLWHTDQDHIDKRVHIPVSSQELSLNTQQPPPREFVDWFRKRKAKDQASQAQSQNGEGGSPPRASPKRTQPPPAPVSNVSHVSHVAQPQPRAPPPPQSSSLPPQHVHVHEQKDGEQQQQQQQQQRRDPALEQDHQKWLRSMSKFFQMFKYQPCLKAALCPKHLNCMRYHSDDDKRRALVSEVDGSLAYVGEPCPQVFDYWNTQTFMTNYVCPKKEKCEYAHNWYEFGYHHRTYKTVKCPYLKLADMVGTYQTKECPFVRSEQWVVQNLPELKIKKVSRNMIHFHGAQVAAIDLCPFYHDEKERRFHDDPPFPAPSSSKAMRGGPPSEHSSSQAHAPYQQQQQQQHKQQQQQPVYPHQQPQAQSYQPQSAPYQPQPPPQQQQQGMPMNMAPHHNNQVVPPHMKPHAQQQQQQQPLYQQQQPLHQQPLHQPRSQQTLFAPPQKSTVDLQAAQAEKNDFKEMQIDYGDNNW
eukprot:CAMPEP_0202702318 /NCGR_PEP_ID=MMETSP1385-20130828/15328_1 /ASSEMBLY_ACC=CAM_ASM_000861 /TAXON_ID=933848 /ORGANISM="Elphidium margaritaceum" /LENGTH=581 /DNA_ID=CAMNT_0049359949 /DNA_START=43 /DNA_END=1788 /DNA_ORIENTATION=-